MKRLLLVMSAIVVCAIAAGAEEETYLVNETAATLYVLAQDSGDVIPGQTTFAPESTYREVPGGGVLPFDAARAVAGFAFTRGSFQLPTFTLTPVQIERMLTQSEQGRTYVTVSDNLLSDERVVSPATFSAVLSQPRIDNQYLDWVSRPAAIARGRTRAPLGVYADFGDGRESIALSDSLLWGRGGTDLQWVKTYLTGSDLFLAASSYTAFARGTAVFLYLYREGDDVPVASLEFPAAPINSSEPFVWLWLPTDPVPRVVGNIAVSEFFFEAQVWADRLRSDVGAELDGLTVEIASASSAAGLWEEFVLARDRFAVLFGE